MMFTKGRAKNSVFHFSFFIYFFYFFYNQSSLCSQILFSVVFIYLFVANLHSIEQLQQMHAGVQQNLVSGTIRRPSEEGRYFKDAVAWLNQQKVNSSYLGMSP